MLSIARLTRHVEIALCGASHRMLHMSNESITNTVKFHYDDHQLSNSMMFDAPRLRGWDELTVATQSRFVSPTAIRCYTDLDPHIHNIGPTSTDTNTNPSPCRFVQPLWAQPRCDYLLQQSRILQRCTSRLRLGTVNELIDLIMNYLTAESICLHIGSLFDVLDQANAWSVGKIIKVDNNNKVRVHFLSWSNRYDEDIRMFDRTGRFAPLYTYTYPSVPIGSINFLCLSNNNNIPEPITHAIPVDYAQYFAKYTQSTRVNPPIRWIPAEIIALNKLSTDGKVVCTVRFWNIDATLHTQQLRGMEKISWRLAPRSTYCR